MPVSWFANMVSHPMGCLFILFVISFVVHKLLSLIRSHLINFCFISITLGNGLEKILLQCVSKSIAHMFSCQNFIVSSLIFKSLIHFEFIFVYGIKECANFIALHMAVQFAQDHLLKRLSFLRYIYSLASFLKD